MKRRAFVALFAAAATAPRSLAQPARPRRSRVACLAGPDEDSNSGLQKRIEAGLASAGLANVEVRLFVAANDDFEMAERAAAQAAAWAPDAILAPGPILAVAAQGATRTIPVVFFAVPDPQAFGLVRSLARPEGNVTGSGMLSADGTLKRLQLVRELLPRARRVATLYRWRARSGMELLARLKLKLSEIAAGLDLQIEDAEVGVGGRGLEATLEALGRRPPDAVLPFAAFAWEPDGSQPDLAALLVGFERRHRAPVISEGVWLVEAGAVAAMYDVGSQLGEGIAILARVLKGTPAGEIPVAMPLRFHLAVNPKAASAIGIVIPPAVMLRADRVVG